MFQGLTQGATISVLYRNIPKVEEGRVTSINTHMPVYNPQQPMAMLNGPVTDITVQVGDDTIPFSGLPANGVVANFPDKGYFIATDRSAILREIDVTASALGADLKSVPDKQRLYQGYEKLRLDMDPEKRREVQHNQEMQAIRNEVTEMRELLKAVLEQKKQD